MDAAPGEARGDVILMYDELIERLRASCESCKLWDGYKCCLKGECSAQKSLQAADAIEELSNIQIAPEKIIQTMWIPVTEQLPEVGKKVLVFAYGNDTLTARMQKRTENGYPVFECNGIFLEMAKLGRITHWMPIPEPPKDGES